MALAEEKYKNEMEELSLLKSQVTPEDKGTVGKRDLAIYA